MGTQKPFPVADAREVDFDEIDAAGEKVFSLLCKIGQSLAGFV